MAVASTNSAVIELVLHEVGHSFGLLGDEYDYGSCSLYEPSSPNVTMETNRDLIKWNIGGGPPTGWIDPATPIPTVSSSNGIPGLYEGAQYCSTGKYRPTYNSKMRSLGPPFEQINEEQLIKRVYNWASPMDSSNPSESEVTLQADEVQLFQVGVLEPLTHALDGEWYVDDQYQLNSLQFSFDSKSFEQGIHTIEVVIWDSTSKVRYDPANVLIEQRNWDIAVVPSGGFIDVPPGYWAYDAIYKIYNAGITKGCSQTPLMYCPEGTVTRAQMAVFLGRAVHGSSFTPPSPTGIFDDVSVSYWAADWIEQFYNDGITSGCNTNPV